MPGSRREGLGATRDRRFRSSRASIAPWAFLDQLPGEALAGGQLGVNQQFGGILLGGELAFVGTDRHETLTGPATFPQERFKTDRLQSADRDRPWRHPLR